MLAKNTAIGDIYIYMCVCVCGDLAIPSYRPGCVQRCTAYGAVEIFRRVWNDVHAPSQCRSNGEVRSRSGNHDGQSKGQSTSIVYTQLRHYTCILLMNTAWLKQTTWPYFHERYKYNYNDISIYACIVKLFLFGRIGLVLKLSKEREKLVFSHYQNLNSQGWVLC